MNKAAILMFSIALVALFSCSVGTQKGCQSCCKNGRNGKDGRNGQDGINGVDGVDGIDGKNGIDGGDGKDGANGKEGPKGKDGKDGINGTNSVGRNWKECSWDKINDPKNDGVVNSCSFTKKQKSTYLYAQAASALHIYNCNSCCKRWFITFDGVECTPVPIDGVVYMIRATSNDVYRPQVILGRCKIEKKDTVIVALNVGNCNGYGNANAHTGWNSATRIYIEEIEGPQYI